MKHFTILFGSITLFSFLSFKSKRPSNLFPSISSYLKNAEKDFDKIPEDRKTKLKEVALFVRTKLTEEKKANLLFICTHNSRRSHMGQLWADAAAEYYGIKGVSNFSGGTESSAFNERAVKALVKTGFVITKVSEGTNPNYEVKYADNEPTITVFSKKYMDPPNPTSDFAAIMTCSQADKACPIVRGASARIAIPYEDPKDSDGKPNETEVYNERCKQIATEVLYIFSMVKSME